jgi:hypothetical protein
LKRNQFGATLGGPIDIPGVIHGKDRFFFFFAYQGQRQKSVTVGPLFTTFTPGELSGDFSHSGPNGGPDPNVVSFLQSHPYFQSNAALAAQGIIDPLSIDPVAQQYIKNNLIPTTSDGIIVPNGPASDNRDEYNAKLDSTRRRKTALLSPWRSSTIRRSTHF